MHLTFAACECLCKLAAYRTAGEQPPPPEPLPPSYVAHMPLNATALETLLEQVEAWKGRKQRHLVAEAEAGERGTARQAATADRAGGEGAGAAAAEAGTLAQQWEVGAGVPVSWRCAAGC